MVDDTKDKVVSNDGVSTTAAATEPTGGDSKKDPFKKVKKDEDKPEAKNDVETPGQEDVTMEEVVVDDSISALFEGLDISEDFKNKVSVVFQAAVNEEVSNRIQVIEADLTDKLNEEMNEAVESKINDIIENLDSYLDYVVKEWMEDNEIAVEAGIKVEMAESLMDGLKDLFSTHNIEVEEATVDIVAELEEEIRNLEEKSNEVINENIALEKLIIELEAERTFDELTEDLSMSQRERLKILSETLDKGDVDEYKENLKLIKESFFETNTVNADDSDDEEDEIIIEETDVKKRPVSEYTSVNALVEALNARKK